MRSRPDVDSEREVIFETGAGTVGISMVYEGGSKLVLRSNGLGGFELLTVEYGLKDSEIAAGELELIWTYDVDGGPNQEEVLTIWIDGEMVAQGMLELGGDWTGADPGSFGADSGNLAGTGQNSGLTGIAFISGSINLENGLAFFGDTLFTGTAGGGPEPAESFIVTNIALTGDGLAINWQEQANAVYDVEFSATLEANSWEVIASALTDINFEDTDSARLQLPAGYYRVVAR